ncbi:MAG: glycosyltransferase family 2 protein [Microbacter sp.]
MPKLSLITINLNNREGLERTIQSVISQTFTNFEYIIIDGGSTDGSVEIIKQFADHITYWISEPDTGIYNAMNKGIKLAKGEYLLFLNSGDFLASNNVLKIVIPLLKSNIDILAGYVKELKEDGINKYPPITFTFKSLYHTNIPHQSEFIKKDLLINLGFYNENLKILSDYDFNIKAFVKNSTYSHVDIMISCIDASGISYQLSNSNIIDSERKQIFASNIPRGMLEDYELFFELDKEFHPALKWAKRNRLIFKVLRFLYNHFSQEKKSINTTR